MRKRLRKGVLTLTFLAVFAVSAGAAQAPPGAAPRGDEVIVTQSASGEELRGRLIELSSTSLAILVDGRRVDVPVDNVLRIDVRNDSLKNGAIIGASVMGGLAVLGCAEAHSAGWCAYAVSINTLLGGAIGASIDAMHKGRSPIYIKTAGKAGSSLQVKFRF
jgi:hypothetical protein